jgi:uncharacterized protein YjbJ (UPF0337 family)
MSKIREKAQGRTREMVGQMIGDDQLVQEGQEQTRKAERESGETDAGSESADERPATSAKPGRAKSPTP